MHIDLQLLDLIVKTDLVLNLKCNEHDYDKAARRYIYILTTFMKSWGGGLKAAKKEFYSASIASTDSCPAQLFGD